MDLTYAENPPTGRLASIVRCTWTLRGAPDDTTDTTDATPAGDPQPVLPDGCVELVFNLAAPFRQLKPDGAVVVQPLHMVVGPASGPTVIAPSGAVDIIGVRLHPWTASVLGVPAASLRDRCVSLDAVAPMLAAQCARALEGARGAALESRTEALLAALDDATAGYVPDRRVAAAVARCDAGGEWTGMGAMARELGIGIRALERLFAAHVGLAPKTLVQILRVQRAIAEVRRNPQRTWAAVAATVGYVDQSHLVREMRRYAGLVPTALEDEARQLTQVFLVPARDTSGVRRRRASRRS